MAMVQPPVHLERRRCTPKTFPCPHCGRPGRRKGHRTFTRTVRGLAYHAIHLIELTTAEYRAACACCTSFRVDRLHRVLSAEQSVHQAWCRRAALVRTAAFQAVPELVRALELLRPEPFTKLVAFLHSPAYRRVRTNNHVERTNRRRRYLEKVRYKWRRRRTLVRFVLRTLDHWRRERPPRAMPTASTESEASDTKVQHRSRPRARQRPAA